MTGEISQGGEESQPSIELLQNGDTLEVKLTGECDHIFKQQIQPEILLAIESEEVKFIKIDFALVTFIDLSFLELLVGLVKRMRAKDGSVGLQGMADKNTRKAFEVMGLDRVFPYLDEDTLDNPEEITEWASKYGAEPALKRYGSQSQAYLSFRFPDQEPSEQLQVISWDDFFEQLGNRTMRYQMQPQQGKEYPYYEFTEPKAN